MIARRALIAAMPALALPVAGQASLPVPAAGMLGFRVVRNGGAIGSHVLRFSRGDSGLAVTIAVDLAVGIGPVTLYRYRHRARETWDGGVLSAFEAETNDDGARSTLRMQRHGEGFAVESSRAGRYVAPASVLPATHWNRRMLDGPFINTQTGELMRPAVTQAGAGPLPWAASVQGDRFVLSGDVDLETWYAGDVWLGLRFKGQDGSMIHYEIT